MGEETYPLSALMEGDELAALAPVVSEHQEASLAFIHRDTLLSKKDQQLLDRVSTLSERLEHDPDLKEAIVTGLNGLDAC